MVSPSMVNLRRTGIGAGAWVIAQHPEDIVTVYLGPAAPSVHAWYATGLDMSTALRLEFDVDAGLAADPEKAGHIRALLLLKVLERVRREVGDDRLLWVNLANSHHSRLMRDAVALVPSARPLPQGGTVMAHANTALRALVAEQGERQRKASSVRPAQIGPSVAYVGTDASMSTGSGRRAFAVVACDGLAEFGPVHGNRGITGAELVAIGRALYTHCFQRGSKAVIYSDSQDAIELAGRILSGDCEGVPAGLIADFDKAVRHHRAFFRDRDCYELVWVRGHRGFPLNDAADRLARFARRNRASGTATSMQVRGAAPTDGERSIVEGIVADLRQSWDGDEARAIRDAQAARQ